MLKKLIVVCLVINICLNFCNNILAVTKTDIISYVNSQKVCGDTSLFNSYKSTFTRLLKQKKLTEDELNTIYAYLESAVGVLNSKGVCKVADVSKLTKAERDLVYNNLTSGAGIITSAPMLGYGEEDEVTKPTEDNINNNSNTNVTNKENTNKDEGTKVTINTQDNTMDIYENGVLIDKVSMSVTKMTYTGANITYVLMVISAVIILGIALVVFILLYKKHSGKTRCIKNICMSCIICSTVVILVICIFGGKIESLTSILSLVSVNENDLEYAVELNQDKSIKRYPSYGANYATLHIPSVGIESNVYYGDTSSILALGIGHTTSSDMPTEGGYVIYSGHNKNDVLGNLQNVSVSDKIIIETTYATCTYVISDTKILKDTQTEKLTKVQDKETLILYTCYPFNTYVYTDERFVVYAVLESIEWR